MSNNGDPPIDQETIKRAQADGDAMFDVLGLISDPTDTGPYEESDREKRKRNNHNLRSKTKTRWYLVNATTDPPTVSVLNKHWRKKIKTVGLPE